jgi:hypothetical protein
VLVTSYAPEDASFLLTDLSGHDLERPLEEREQQIQAGRNYAEVLPIEYRPEPSYLALFEALLDRTAPAVALAVAQVSEQILCARHRRPVLVSLARAGSPIGILVRRWALERHGLDVPHYSISIIRGVGIDTAALDHIVARHDPADVIFIDGWSGKGAITRELCEALSTYRLSGGPAVPTDLAVLADPGSCARYFATREDVLVPSACLNATVCGLMSRTVYRPELIGPEGFHGAKVYWHMKADDRSAAFLDAVISRFALVEPADAMAWSRAAHGREPRCTGAAQADAVCRRFGLPSANLVKPGIGETTRVLLRRRPWQILVRPDRMRDLAHVVMLAEARGVPLVEYPDMHYACVGLIAPTK